MWNKKVFGNINQVGEDIFRRIQELDERDDESDIVEEERKERRMLLVEQRRNEYIQEVLLQQKAR